MSLVSIREPIWKYKAVGVSRKTLEKNGQETEIEITYTNKSGKRLWPERYHPPKDWERYPSMVVNYGVEVVLLPIDCLESC